MCKSCLTFGQYFGTKSTTVPAMNTVLFKYDFSYQCSIVFYINVFVCLNEFSDLIFDVIGYGNDIDVLFYVVLSFQSFMFLLFEWKIHFKTAIFPFSLSLLHEDIC